MKFLPAMISLVTAADKIQIDYYHESVGPLDRKTITESFKTAMDADGFTTMATINFYPYGHAKEVVTIPDDKWKFTCHNYYGDDDEECTWNMVMACGTEHISSRDEQFEFVECIMANRQPNAKNYEELTNKCVKSLASATNDLGSEINSCHASSPDGSDDGNAFMHTIALKTKEISKVENWGDSSNFYIPWVVADGVHNEHIQLQVTIDLLGYVCDNYQGKKAAACNTADTAFLQ